VTATFERSASVSAVAAVMLQHMLCILQETNSSLTDRGWTGPMALMLWLNLVI
jgi:hypothetical protein